ncbi:MAG: hypothetical protein NVV74_10180 [Magnetospirillum sp.]|nr:hypothetical protein [Magnetospirillum sp.]
MEKEVELSLLQNWRFQLTLSRSYLDMYMLKRKQFDERIQQDALKILKSAKPDWVMRSVTEARAVFGRWRAYAYGLPERARVLQLGEALFQSIGMRLSVAPHRAMSQSRGATLDSLDWALNDRGWWEQQFASIEKLRRSKEQMNALQAALRWEDVQTGEVYIDFGKEISLTRKTWPSGVSMEVLNAEDSVRMQSWIRGRDIARMRLSWLDHLGSAHGSPLTIRFSGLAPKVSYELMIVYGNLRLNGASRLSVNGVHEIHPHQRGPEPAEPLYFTLPARVNDSGVLEFKWEHLVEKGSLDGLTHVSELRLRKKLNR